VEWMSPFTPDMLAFHEVYFFAAFLALALLFLLGTIWRGYSRALWPYLGLSAFFFIVGLSANRFVSTSVLGLSLVSVAIPGAWRPRIYGAPGVMVFASGALVLSLLTGTYWHTGMPHKIGFGVDGRMFPTKTVEMLKELPERGPVWNSFYFGCFLAWELEEQKKIFIHGFVIDMGIFQRYYNGIGLDRAHFDQLTKQYNINEMLIQKDPKSVALFNILTVHPEWQIGVQDDSSVLFERR